MLKIAIIQKLPNGKYRLYSKKKDSSGKRRNLGTFDSRSEAEERERQVQFFKHQNDDGLSDDNETKALDGLSNIAKLLEEAGMIDKANEVYSTMNAIDSNFTEERILSIPITVANMILVANKLDDKQEYGLADEIDSIIKGLVTQNIPVKKKKRKKKNKDEDMDRIVDLIGKTNITVTDNQNAGMFQGLSDSYFNTGYDNLESPYK